ncbi:hypothetical protein [Flavobacterium sp. XGLA_31]|uniref:hypothetical protein n=1 Tax=Flavobacterium sp. XGLA_31 TaxID=3447666 RepID=UPI003F3A11A7
MKTVKLFGCALFVMAATLWTSCSSSSDGDGGSGGTQGITFKADGTAVTASSVDATLYSNSVAGGRYIDVYAFQGTNQILEFHFPPKTGSFTANQTMDMSHSWLTYMTNNGLDYPGDYFGSTSGTINVTTCDTINNKIVATFNFVGDNGTVTKTISEGTLNINAISHD